MKREALILELLSQHGKMEVLPWLSIWVFHR